MNCIHYLRTGHLRRFAMGILVIVLAGSWPRENAVGEDKHELIQVRNRKTLSVDKIRCERIPLGEPDDYKPSIALLPNGELLLVMFHGYRKGGGKILEQTLLYRSHDGGQTWSGSEKLDLSGREPYLTVTKDGTIFITAHLLRQEVRNKDGYTYSLLHRSQDGGRTWTTTRLQPKEFRPRTIGLGTREMYWS